MTKSRGLQIAFLLLCIGINFVIYYPTALYFLNDDMIHLPLCSKGILFQHHSFRPIHDLLLVTEYRLWGINPIGYHVVEWLIHILCSILIYSFTKALLKEYSNQEENSIEKVAILTAVLFSFYAFHSEAVLWVLGSGASLSTLLFLLSIVAYLKREKGIIYFVLSLLFFQIGLFTYEAIWVAPLFICLLSYLSVKEKVTSIKKEKLFAGLYLLTFFSNILIRKLILGEVGGTYGNDKIFDFNLKRLAYNGICFFTRSFVPPSISSKVFVVGLFLLLTFLSVFISKLYLLKKIDKIQKLLVISFFASLLPVITLGISTHSRESERFLYLPSVFLCFWIIYTFINTLSSKWVTCSIAFLLVYNIAFTYINARDYRVAGNISKAFYTYFKSIENKSDSIDLENLPRQFNGLPLFRSGFKEGIAWLYQIDTNKIIITNDLEIQAAPSYYRTFYKSDNFKFKYEMNKANHNLKLVYDTNFFSMKSYDTP